MTDDVRVGPIFNKKLGSFVSIRFTRDDAELIHAEAERRAMSLSAYLRWAAFQHIGEPDPPEEAPDD